MTTLTCGFGNCKMPADVERCTGCTIAICIDHVIYTDDGEAFCPDCYPEAILSEEELMGEWPR